MIISNKGGGGPDIYTGRGMQESHPANSPCREAYKNWCCNPNGKPGTSGRLSWDPITVMIAALDVESVLEKEVDYGTQITADSDGKEHFFGSGTKNALTVRKPPKMPTSLHASRTVCTVYCIHAAGEMLTAHCTYMPGGFNDIPCAFVLISNVLPCCT